MTLNFIGNTVVDCISVLFLWYYQSVIKSEKILDSRGDWTWKTVKNTTEEKQRHFKLVLDDKTVYVAWNRPENLVIQIVFSCDESLFTSTDDWAVLVDKCII